jgi:Zn-dependent protease with chaperone function
MRLRLYVVAVPCLLLPAFELLAPQRHSVAFGDEWALFSTQRWAAVRLLGVGLDRVMFGAAAAVGGLLLVMDLVPWLRDRGDFAPPTVACPPEVSQTVARLAAALRLPVPEVEVVDSPATVLFCRGVLRPRVVVSTGTLGHLDQRELEGALGHELSHLAMGDVGLGWVLLGVRVVQFFNPVVQVLVRAVALDAEERADAAAARLTSRPAALAAALLSMFRSSGAHPLSSEVLLGAALARAHEAPIAARCRKLLAPPEAPWSAFETARLLAGVVAISAVLFFVT